MAFRVAEQEASAAKQCDPIQLIQPTKCGRSYRMVVVRKKNIRIQKRGSGALKTLILALPH